MYFCLSLGIRRFLVYRQEEGPVPRVAVKAHLHGLSAGAVARNVIVPGVALGSRERHDGVD